MALVDDLLPSYQQALSILQRSESTPLTDDEKRQYQQEVLNMLNDNTTGNDFVEQCKVMAQAALDADSAFDRVEGILSSMSTIFSLMAALTWAHLKQVSEWPSFFAVVEKNLFLCTLALGCETRRAFE